jgi:hypothetical protein
MTLLYKTTFSQSSCYRMEAIMVCRLCIKAKMGDKPYKATSTTRTFKHLVIFHRQQLSALYAAQKIADNSWSTEPLLLVHVTRPYNDKM